MDNILEKPGVIFDVESGELVRAFHHHSRMVQAAALHQILYELFERLNKIIELLEKEQRSQTER